MTKRMKTFFNVFFKNKNDSKLFHTLLQNKKENLRFLNFYWTMRECDEFIKERVQIK
jgi:hypothetical protein